MNLIQRRHTHCQATQASTLTKACQCVCLPQPGMKEENQIKTSPSLDWKKGEISVKKDRRMGATVANSVYVAIADEVVNRRSVLLKNFVLKRQESSFNPLLHIHANRISHS